LNSSTIEIEGGSVTTTVYLIRHAAHAFIDRVLVGRSPQVTLSTEGQLQARRLGRSLACEPIDRVQTSPQSRAVETAQPIADELALPVEIVLPMDELDMGDWTGLSFDELASDPRWHDWNSQRATARPPGGESMRELQERVLGHLSSLCEQHPDSAIAIVSHAEPIRAAILHYRGLPLDAFMQVRIDPCAVSVLTLGAAGGAIVGEENTVAEMAAP
jgi:probable phosphoglycerate mutase